MNIRRTPLVALPLAFLALAGCGGGSPNLGRTVPTPPGLYVGTSTNGGDLALVVQPSGEFSAFYTPSAQAFPGITYSFQGQGAIAPGSFSAAGVKVHGVPWVSVPPDSTPVTFLAQYFLDGTFQGEIADGPITFPFRAALRDPVKNAAAADFQGAFTQQLSVMDGATGIAADRTCSLTVAETGRISGTFAPQQTAAGKPVVPAAVTGALTLRADGSTFSVTLSVAQADPGNVSVLDGRTFIGEGYYDRTTKYLAFGAATADGSLAIAFEAPGPN